MNYDNLKSYIGTARVEIHSATAQVGHAHTEIVSDVEFLYVEEWLNEAAHHLEKAMTATLIAGYKVADIERRMSERQTENR